MAKAVPHHAAASPYPRYDLVGDPRKLANRTARLGEIETQIGGDGHALEPGRLLDRLVVVIDEFPELGSLGDAGEADVDREVEPRREREAGFASDRQAAEVALVDGEHVHRLGEHVAAGVGVVVATSNGQSRAGLVEEVAVTAPLRVERGGQTERDKCDGGRAVRCHASSLVRDEGVSSTRPCHGEFRHQSLFST